MFLKTQTLPRSSNQQKILPTNLQSIQATQKIFQNDLSSTLADKRNKDIQNTSLITEAINEISRLVTTEQENLRSEMDPLLDDLSTRVEGFRELMENKIQKIDNTFEQDFLIYEKQLKSLEGGLDQLIQDRQQAVKSMKSEFIISSDRLQKQINDEKDEQQKIYQNLEDMLEKQLFYCQDQLSSEYKRKEKSHNESREDFTASARLVQGSVMKKYGTVLDTLNKIIQDNQIEKQDRNLQENEIALTIQEIVSNMKKSLEQVGKFEE